VQEEVKCRHTCYCEDRIKL